MIGEIRTQWRLFIYNHFKRHWCDFLMKRRWVAGGFDPVDFPKGGKVSREAYDFMVAALTAANEALEKKRNR